MLCISTDIRAVLTEEIFTTKTLSSYQTGKPWCLIPMRLTIDTWRCPIHVMARPPPSQGLASSVTLTAQLMSPVHRSRDFAWPNRNCYYELAGPITIRRGTERFHAIHEGRLLGSKWERDVRPLQGSSGPWRERRRCQPSQRAYFSAPGAEPDHDGNKRSRIRVKMIGYRSSEREAMSLHARGLRADSRDTVQCAVSRATIPRPTPCFDAHATRIAPRAINPWRSVTVPPDPCSTATVLPAPRPLGSKTRKASFP
jgi:hypothetical protein